MEQYEIYLGDCLEKIKNIQDNSINLVLIDPPYNISKAEWDKWETVEDYVEFMGKVFKEIERVLKPNGSFYFFHNDFLQIVELQNWINKNTGFQFKQMLVWNKRFNEASNKGFLDGFIEPNGLRNYQKMAEYCLYYTFQDGASSDKTKSDTDNFKSLRCYFETLQKQLGVTKKTLIEKVGQRVDHCFRWGSSQWDMPTEETYNKLIELFKINELSCFREYENLKQEYENLRYTFHNLKQHHSIINCEIAKKVGHATPKPISLLLYLIRTSSNENDIVLDCFMGSGSTGVACMLTDRKFIGIELDDKYFEIAENRIKESIDKKEELLKVFDK